MSMPCQLLSGDGVTRPRNSLPPSRSSRMPESAAISAITADRCVHWRPVGLGQRQRLLNEDRHAHATGRGAAALGARNVRVATRESRASAQASLSTSDAASGFEPSLAKATVRRTRRRSEARAWRSPVAGRAVRRCGRAARQCRGQVRLDARRRWGDREPRHRQPGPAAPDRWSARQRRPTASSAALAAVPGQHSLRTGHGEGHQEAGPAQ